MESLKVRLFLSQCVGIILFEMLTGSRPYRNDTPMRLALMHVLEPIPRIGKVNPDLPSGCEMVIDRALAKNREERYPTAVSLAMALNQVAARQQDASETVAVLPGFAQPRARMIEWLPFLSRSAQSETPAAAVRSAKYEGWATIKGGTTHSDSINIGAQLQEDVPSSDTHLITAAAPSAKHAKENGTGSRLWFRQISIIAGICLILLLPLCTFSIWWIGSQLIASPIGTPTTQVLTVAEDMSATPTPRTPAPTSATVSTILPVSSPSPDPNLPPVEAYLGAIPFK